LIQQPPDDLARFEAECASLGEQRRWADLAQLHEARAEAVADPAEAIRSLLAAAQLWEDQAGSLRQAVDSLRQVLQLEPAQPDALRRLRTIYSRYGRQGELVDLLLEQVEHAEPAQGGRICLEIAALCASTPGQAGSAVRWYRAAWQRDQSLSDEARAGLDALHEAATDDPDALAALQEVYSEQCRWETVREVLQRRVELTDELQAQADLLCDLAQVVAEQLGRADEALVALEQAAALGPLRTDRILEGLVTLRQARPDGLGVLAALRAYHAEAFRWADVLDVGEAQVALSPAEAGGELLLELGEIEATRLFSGEGAVARYRRALELDPTLAKRVQTALGDVLRDWPELQSARALLTQAASLSGDWDRATLVLDEADADQTYSSFAAASLEHALELDPSDRDAIAQLRDHYTATEDWEPLVRVLEREAELAAGPRAEAELHYEIGHVLEQRLQRNEQAAAHFRRAAKLVREDVRFLDAGRRVFRILGKWDVVDRLLEAALDVVRHEDRRLQLLLDRADVLFTGLGEPDRAFLMLLEALDLAPDHPQAVRLGKELLSIEEARGPIEECLLRHASRAASTGSARFVRIGQLHELEPPDLAAAADAYRQALALSPDHTGAFRRVEAVLTQLGRWQELADTYERAARRAIDPDEEEAWRLKAARVLDRRLGDGEQAARAYRDALGARPSDEALRHRIVERLREGEDYAELVDVYRSALATDLDAGERATLLRDWAAVCEGPLSDPHAASEPWCLLLDLEPADPEGLQALRGRCRDGSGEPEQLLARLDAALAAAPEQAPELLAEAAELCERQLGDPDGAIRRWELRRTRQPADGPACEALLRLYEGAARWDDLLALWLDLAERARTRRTRIGALREAVRVVLDHLDDAPRQIEVLLRLVAVDPRDGESLESLAELYDDVGDWQAQADVLARLAAVQPDEASLATRRRRAILLRDRLDQPTEALAELRGILALKPDDSVALAAAEPLLQGPDDRRELLAVLTRRSRLQPDAALRLDILARAAHLAERTPGEEARAPSLWRAVLEDAPQDCDALARLATYYETHEAWYELATTIEAQAEAAADSAERLAHLRSLGALSRERLGDHERARRAWEQVLEAAPNDLEASEALESILAERADWTELARLLERRLEHGGREHDVVDLLLRLATIRENVFGDPQGALAALDRARDHAPESRRVLAELRRLYHQLGRSQELMETLEVELDSAADGEAIPICLDAGQTLWRELDLPEEAARWYERVRDRDPSCREALLALRAIYDGLGEDEGLLPILTALVEQAGADDERLALLTELARRAERAGRPQLAIEHYETARRVAPERDELRLALRRVAATHGLWERLLESWQVDLVWADQLAEKRTILLDSAEVLEKEIDDPLRAFATYRAVFQLDPDADEALEGMRRQAGRAGLWAQLAPVLEQTIDREPAARLTAICELAAIRGKELADPNGAFAELRRALLLDPTREQTHSALEALALETGRWTDLVDVLHNVAASVSERQARVDLYRQSALLSEQELEDPSAALDDLIAAFRLDPVRPDLVDELLRLGEKTGAWDLLDPVLREGADRVTEPALRARLLSQAAHAGDRDLVDARTALETQLRAFRLDPRATHAATDLEILARGLDALVEAVDVFGRVAEEAPVDLELPLRRRSIRLLLEDLDDPVAALPHLRRVWRIDPEDRETAASLVRILGERERWRELAEVHAVEAERTPELPERVAHLAAEADLHARRLGQPQEAVRVLARVVQLEPGNLGALERMEGIYAALGDTERLVGCLEARAARVGDPSEARTLRLSAARIWDIELDRPERARALYRGLVDDGDEDALLALEAVSLREGWWDELSDALVRRLGRATDRESRVHLLWRLTEITDERLGDRPRAAAYLAELLELEPDHDAAADRLVAWLRERGRWAELADVLAQRLVGRGDATLWQELGELYERRLARLDDAARAYAEAHALMPESPASLGGLLRVAWVRQRWEDVVAHGRALAAATDDPEVAADALSAAGAALFNELRRPAEAVASYEAALEHRPSDRRVLAALTGAYRELRDWEAADRCLARTVELLGDPSDPTDIDRLAEAWTVRGMTALEQGDRRGALESLYRAIRTSPEARRARRTLADLAWDSERWDIAAEHLRVLCEAPADDEEPRTVAAWRARLARCLERMDRDDEAVEQWGLATALHPRSRAARRGLVETLWRLERWEAVAPVLRDLVSEPAQDLVAKAADLRRLGTLLADRLGRVDEGLAVLEEAGRLAPEDPDLLSRLYEGYAQTGDSGRAAETAAALATLARAPSEVVPAHVRHGRAAMDAGHHAEAEAAFARALEVDPTSEVAALGIAAARSGRGDGPGAADALQRYVDAAGQTIRQPSVEVWRRLAEGRRDQPGQRAAWRDALVSLVRSSPGDADALADLFAAWQEDGDANRAFPAADLLVFVRCASPDVVRFHTEYVGWQDRADARELRAVERRTWVDDPAAHGPIHAALAALVDALPRLFTSEPAAAGLAPEQRVDTEGTRSLPRRFSRLAAALGVSGRTLWVRDDRDAQVGVFAGVPPAVVVGAGLVRGMLRAEQRFHLARGLALTEGARPLARSLEIGEGQALLDALRGQSEGSAAAWRERLSGALPEATLARIAAVVEEAPDAQFADWAEAVERSATRTALCLCRDVGTALKALRREVPSLRARSLRDPGGLADLVAHAPLAADLIDYALSARFARVLGGG